VAQEVLDRDLIGPIHLALHVQSPGEGGRQAIHHAIAERQLPFLYHSHHGGGDVQLGDAGREERRIGGHGATAGNRLPPRSEPSDGVVAGPGAQHDAEDLSPGSERVQELLHPGLEGVWAPSHRGVSDLCRRSGLILSVRAPGPGAEKRGDPARAGGQPVASCPAGQRKAGREGSADPKPGPTIHKRSSSLFRKGLHAARAAPPERTH